MSPVAASGRRVQERLWAPWRSKFLSQRRTRRCIFCTARDTARDRRHLVVARGRQVFALLNLYPYNNGHLMIAPRRHVGTLARLQPAEWAEMLTLAQRLTARLERTVHPQGFNLGINLGRVAGAGLPGHMHLHLVPRWRGDANFITTVGGAKIISQSLDEMYRLLTRSRRGR